MSHLSIRLRPIANGTPASDPAPHRRAAGIFGVASCLCLLTATLATVLLPSARLDAAPASSGFIESSPKAHDVVDGSAVAFSLRFEAPVDHSRSTLSLRSSDGVRQLRPRLGSAANYLFGHAGRLAPGTYELAWKARLSGGEVRSGTIPFTVR